MTVSIATLTNGDLDYVNRLNSNFQAIASAIDGMASLIGGTVSSTITAPTAWEALFGPTVSVIGDGSYAASISSTDIVLALGFAWLPSTKTLVKKVDPTTITFVGAASGTHYVHIGNDGTPFKDQTATDAFYSVVWDGSALSALTRIAKVTWGDSDWQSAQTSAALGATYTKLDSRLEAGEAKAVNGDKAYVALNGKITKAVDGGVAVTLTSTEAGNTYFEFTGVLTADIDINFPLSSTPRIINVKNSTTGEFAINCKGSGGTGKKVAQGYSTLLHHDGANMEYAVDDPTTIAKVVPYAAAITLDWSQYDVAYITLTGNATINHTGGRPGQKCLLYIEQGGAGGFTVTWGANVRYGTDVGGITLSSAAGKVDELAFSYNWVRSLYNTVSVSRGYDTV